MRCILRFSACLILCSALAVQGEVIDRILAVVDGRIITQSDVRQEREVRERLGLKAAETDKALVQSLIDDRLIESEIADFPGVDATDGEVTAYLQSSVARDGVASAALRNAVGRHIRMQKVFDVKFRQSIRPGDDDIRKYYDEVFVPKARESGLNPIPPLSDPQMAKAVHDNVVQELMDHEVSVWLDAIRKRSSIEVFD
jgi:parvulin-like peptidyl-prolyl isomerase